SLALPIASKGSALSEPVPVGWCNPPNRVDSEGRWVSLTRRSASWDRLSIREVAHEATPAVRVVPARVQAIALEFMAESEGRLNLHGPRQRRIGDDLVAAGVVALIQRSRHDLSDPGGPERSPG